MPVREPNAGSQMSDIEDDIFRSEELLDDS
jgi:hypothetical protein